MLGLPNCHKRASESGSSEDVPGEAISNGSNVNKWLKNSLLAGSLVLAPHALCVLGIGTAGLGGLAVHSWCRHGESEADSSHGVELRRLPAVPEEYIEFPKDRNEAAGLLLRKHEPRFEDIIIAKQEEAHGIPIKVVFLESGNEDVSVVICKNGALCPCSKPQAYVIGNRADIAVTEQYRGQHSILEALYGENRISGDSEQNLSKK